MRSMKALRERRRRRCAAACAVLLAGAAIAAHAQIDCTALAADTRVEPIGRFSNTRYTEEHAEGYDVLLWMADGCLIGVLSNSPGGLAGDTPTGLIEGVDYRPATGVLSFGAKLTTALMVSSENGALISRPSQDYFTFRGTLNLAQGTLAGVMEHARRTAPASAQPESERVTLPLNNARRELYPNAVTYGEWRSQLEPILRARGPKW